MEYNPERPSYLHASTQRGQRSQPGSRAEWRRHLDCEPHGVLRKHHRGRRPVTRTAPPGFES